MVWAVEASGGWKTTGGIVVCRFMSVGGKTGVEVVYGVLTGFVDQGVI